MFFVLNLNKFKKNVTNTLFKLLKFGKCKQQMIFLKIKLLALITLTLLPEKH